MPETLDSPARDTDLTPAMNTHHQEFFDRAASDWDLMFTAEELDRLGHLVDSLGINSGIDVLDLGCGTGVLFDMLRRKVGELGLVVGVDFSLNMTFLARRNFPFANVCVVDADASALPFADTCFDMALAFSSFPHFADHQCALNELCRILKPNARLYILHLVSSLQLAEIHRRVGGAVEEDRLPSNEILHDMLVRSGFANIEIEDKPNLYLARAVRTPENVPSCRP